MFDLIRDFLQELKMRIRVLIQDIRQRRRLRRICEAIDVRPYRWQRDFALGLIGCDAFPSGRATGKTTAVMLRLLMLPPNASSVAVRTILARDPDWTPSDPLRCRWYAYEYVRLRAMCMERGIETVSALEEYRVWRHKK